MRLPRIVLPLAVTLLAAPSPATAASGGAAFAPAISNSSAADIASSRGGVSAPPASAVKAPANRRGSAAGGGAYAGVETRSGPRRTRRATAPRGTTRRKDKRRPRRARPRPVAVAAFSVAGGRFYHGGRPLRVIVRLRGRGGPWTVTLVARRDARAAAANGSSSSYRVDLGIGRSGSDLTASVTPQALLPTAPGTVALTLAVRDRRGQRVPLRGAPTVAVRVLANAFPVRGTWRFAGADGAFGADRGHYRHQGQDIVASEGTPVVAPAAGVVVHVAYQRGGAGHYVVLRDERAGRDYVFMHLAAGSLRVHEGDRVTTGQQLAAVGATGRASGPHLHFEVWRGRWQDGGEPIDPLPLLRRWASAEGITESAS